MPIELYWKIYRHDEATPEFLESVNVKVAAMRRNARVYQVVSYDRRQWKRTLYGSNDCSEQKQDLKQLQSTYQNIIVLYHLHLSSSLKRFQSYF